MAARLLADWGAEVIRVERPVGGDMSRQLARAMVGGGPIPSNIDYVSENINRNNGLSARFLDFASNRLI
jgi:crotonobetainyl-CoA:carnitine CoA-transferase CaiB-like acyl-CoA transferase